MHGDVMMEQSYDGMFKVFVALPLFPKLHIWSSAIVA